MTVIVLHGDLRRQFGGPFPMDVATPGEAVRALCSQLRGFRRRLQEGAFRLVRRAGGRRRDVDLSMLDMTLGDGQSFHVVPVLAGSKSGAGKAILGIAIVAAAFVFAPAVVGALGPTMGMATTAFSVAGFGVTFSQIAGFGAMMALGGVAQMLSPTPKVSSGSGGGRAEANASFIFNGPLNAIEQGNPVPLVYGRFHAGSVLVSSSMTAENI